MTVIKIKHKIPWITFLGATLILLGGIVMFFLPSEVVEFALLFAVIGILFVYGIVRLVQAVSENKWVEGILAVYVCWTIAWILMYLDYKIETVAVLPSLIVGIVSLLLGILRLMICVNSILNRFRGAVRNGISGFFCLLFGILLVINPIQNFSILALVASFYMIFYAVTMYGDAFAAIFQTDLNANRRKRRTHFAAPNLLNAIKPSGMISEINQQIERGKLKSGKIVEEKEQTQFDHTNIEIMVHLTTQGPNKFGHVDIAIGDTVYSYGTYDESKVKFMGFVAQGSFIAIPKLPYLRYCLDVQKKYVIGFGACLSDVQLKTVTDRLETFMANDCEPIVSEYEHAVKEGRDGADYNDRISVFVRDYKCKVYSVVSGPYKRYFGININCVQFADWLLSDSGIDAISFSGIRTPGAYYSMLNNMFHRKNTRVIRKTSYIFSKDIDAQE